MSTGTLILFLLTMAPAPQTPLDVYPVGGEITEPKKVKNVAPRYPEAAQRAALQGVVLLECEIGADGRVRSVRALQGPPPLVAPATEAVRKWRYTPTLLQGKAVAVIMTVTVNFKHHGQVTLPELIDSLDNRDPYIRESAAKALGQLGPQASKAIPALMKAANDGSEIVRTAAAEALTHVQGH